ncbi:hypothetical protein LEP1GSC123_0295 [Leptospira borgpetersenii str. 200701203]|uniref:Uncharacterized protein n=1 Tax=Leptospira borgpetersenii str. 200701203 TaxID=1193007 RepID=M3FJP4_LEPBO|nr:hypothetical protein LEP1GSC123_0295 [Leptospira borgpetersenii str. 200701203]
MFYQRNKNKNIGFVSLSGVRPPHADWFVIPNLTKKKNGKSKILGVLSWDRNLESIFFLKKKFQKRRMCLSTTTRKTY